MDGIEKRTGAAHASTVRLSTHHAVAGQSRQTGLARTLNMAQIQKIPSRSGSVHSAEEKMLFIDGLQPGVRPLVSLHSKAESTTS